MVNVLDNEECLSCKLNKYDLMDSFNDEYLIEQEKLERERKEKEYRERDEKLKKQREAALGNRLVNLELVEVRKPTAPARKVVEQKPITLEELILEEIKPAPKKVEKPLKLELIEDPIELLELVEDKVVAPKPVGPRPVSPKLIVKPVIEPVENELEELPMDLIDEITEKVDELIEIPSKKPVKIKEKRKEDKPIKKKEEKIIEKPIDNPKEEIEKQDNQDDIIESLDLSDWLV